MNSLDAVVWARGRRACGVRWRAWLLASAWSALITSAVAVEAPRITGIERRGEEVVVRATVPSGVARLVLESCARDDWRGWVPRAVLRVEPGTGEVRFATAAGPGSAMFRVRADTSDPLPAAFYSGTTNFPGELVADGVFGDAFLREGDAAAPPTNAEGGGGREVVESDIWVIDGDRLYFFNQFRGLQRIDVADPDHPRLEGTFPLPGAGEQMYLLPGGFAVLLAHDPCQQWSQEAESALLVVEVGSLPLREVARLPVRGRIVESRLVGSALYIAAETWQPVAGGDGAWQSGTWVSGFDLSDPRAPVAREPKWFPGSGNVVTATDRFLFVAITDYSRGWPWASDLQVVDITAPDGTLNPFARIPLAGRVADKFKLDLLDDVLRVVVEAMDAPSGGRWVTVLETLRLADPRAAAPVAFTRLDRLELARGERLFATRFDGARAYVVTFLRIDPLWVIDLSDPADLKVAGELEIPGWSTYLRPMGDRLLTLGVDDARGWRVAVQLFDVSDPSRPALLAKIPLGEDSSWSEANQDEKAFGVFPEAGLLLVPVSEWTANEVRQGVQLIDFGRDHLTRRGVLSSSTVVPRRATFRDERVLSLSGRELITAEVTDRDHPRIVGSVELAYPVERVVVADGFRVEFTPGSMRVLPVDTDVAEAVTVAIGDLPVWGATYREGRLHVLQGRPAEVAWVYDDRTSEWVGQTNAGVILATTWSANALPQVTRLGEARTETGAAWLSDVRPLWLGGHLLVWGTASSNWGYWRWGGLPWFTDAVVAADAAPRFWTPWWSDGKRRLMAVDLGASGTPERVVEIAVDGEGSASGDVASHGTLIYGARRVLESEVVKTNQIVEKVWFPGETVWVTNIVGGPDGTTKTEVVRVAEGGEWRSVTNDLSVYRWWARYVLDVVDLAGGLEAPVRRPEVALPGSLLGISHEGAILYTLGERSAAADEAATTWLEASAYDGVEVRLIDAVAVARAGNGETAAVTLGETSAYVARGGWTTNTVQRLEVWSLGGDGRWARGATVGLSAAPGELAVFNDLLVARSGGVVDLFDRSDPSGPVPLPVADLPACFGGDLRRGDGDRGQGLWLPLGDYGAVRVGP